MGRICIEKAGITSLKSDAVVNAANEALQEGNGVCGEIFKEAGPRELQAACEAIGGCRTGNAVITPGFKLRSKYIIHAVGPQWIDGNHNESKQLYNAYKQSLILASQNGCKSIAFPLISSGNFGYPVNKAWEQALQSCLDFQKENPNSDLLIQFAVIDDKTLDAGKKMLAELNNEKTTLYLKELDSESLQKIRCRISKKWDLLLDKKAHPIAAGLMSVLCDQKVIDGLAVEQLIKMIESIFPEPVLHESWISQFGNLLLRVVNAAVFTHIFRDFTIKSLCSLPPISLAVCISVIKVFNVSSFAAKYGLAFIKFFGSQILSPLSNAYISTKKSSAFAIPLKILQQ